MEKPARDDRYDVALVWPDAPEKGRIEVAYGALEALEIEGAGSKVKKDSFTTRGGPARLTLRFRETATDAGSCPTRVTVHCGETSFSFFLRDVSGENPPFVPVYGVAVIPAQDPRDFDDLCLDIAERGLITKSARMCLEPEETLENACAHSRQLVGPTWLGLSRDLRIFSLLHNERFGYWGDVQALYHSMPQHWPTKDEMYKLTINFVVGRGAGAPVEITRRLEDGKLPILHSTQLDGPVRYDMTAFVTLENEPLQLATLRGSEWLALYANSAGNMLTEEERRRYREELEQPELRKREQETVCVLQWTVLNTDTVPRYAYICGSKATAPDWVTPPTAWKEGLLEVEGGLMAAANLLNGKPMQDPEVAVLLQPGQTIHYTLLVPHRPLPVARARKLFRLKVEEHLQACRNYWVEKLHSGATIYLPEPALDERLSAGLLHCDIVTYGREPKGSVAATIGVYSPIGSESAPIIQFFDSMGWHSLAERCIQFFLDRQREDGFIQTFGGYQLETGPLLWTMGEHYRYTRDVRWVRRVKDKLLKSCNFLLEWRERNKREELRGRGYGLLDGKVADPEDFFHSFMLNGLSHAGLSRAAEMLAEVDPAEAERLAIEAAAYREDIRTSFIESQARSPLVPLGDGTWVPSYAPWSEYPGPVTLYADGGSWFTHGTFLGRDSMLGAQYLVLGEVFEAEELPAELSLQAHQELFTINNAAFSQPYYARHDYCHARRGEVKEFLKTLYNQMAALQDRETYSVWEHYFHASPHKTHEEGWMMMQLRWMLWLEEGDTLNLLRLIPRRWLESGQEITLNQVATYFGPVSLQVRSRLDEGIIEAEVQCDPRRAPALINLRLPHPRGARPRQITGGTWDPATETVTIPGGRKASVTLRY